MQRRNDWTKFAVVYVTVPLLLLAIVFVAWYSVGGLPAKKFGEVHTANEFGDQHGYVNSLFAGVAFAGVVYAIVLQTIELKYQRRELIDNRTQLTRTASAQEETTRNLFASAYLSSFGTLVTTLGEAAESPADRSFRPQAVGHVMLANEMELMVRRMLEMRSVEVERPTRFEIVRFAVDKLTERLGATLHMTNRRGTEFVRRSVESVQEAAREVENLVSAIPEEPLELRERNLRNSLMNVLQWFDKHYGLWQNLDSMDRDEEELKNHASMFLGELKRVGN